MWRLKRFGDLACDTTRTKNRRRWVITKSASLNWVMVHLELDLQLPRCGFSRFIRSAHDLIFQIYRDLSIKSTTFSIFPIILNEIIYPFMDDEEVTQDIKTENFPRRTFGLVTGFPTISNFRN